MMVADFTQFTRIQEKSTTVIAFIHVDLLVRLVKVAVHGHIAFWTIEAPAVFVIDPGKTKSLLQRLAHSFVLVVQLRQFTAVKPDSFTPVSAHVDSHSTEIFFGHGFLTDWAIH